MRGRATQPALSADAMLAAILVAVSPFALGGASVKARAGPEREAWLARLHALLPADMPKRRVPLHIGDDRLLGGLDLAATLHSGRPVVQRGLLAECDGGLLTLPMAERTSPGLAAKLAFVMDAGAVVLERDALAERHPSRFGLILLDEGIDDDPPPPACLLDRLAFHIHLEPPGSQAKEPPLAEVGSIALDDITPGDIAAAQGRLASVEAADSVVEAICAATLALGVSSARALSLTLGAARASAALAGRDRVTEADASLAARLVLAPRATCVPAQDEPAETSPPNQPQESAQDRGAESEADETRERQQGAPENMVLAAAKAAIPADLLAKLAAFEDRRAREAGSGRAKHLQAASLRGRPVGTRRGLPKPGQRLNLLETLRAAAPWQAVRRQDGTAARQGEATRLQIRRDDFRVTRRKHHPETTTIFVVDASGSTALHRLAEAKGAVELLLADCYVRRDSVALMTFSGQNAELLLPPTRSLTRVKRSLAGFPAGGGTPLATAIDAAGALAESIRRKARTPTIVLLTDGRGNIARDGTADREKAASDALAAARALAASGLPSLLIDISPRPRPVGRELAAEMRARYLALPHADAQALSNAVQAHARAQGG